MHDPALIYQKILGLSLIVAAGLLYLYYQIKNH
jgi:hypothetical protein